MASAEPVSDQPIFEAVLVPHRSLSRRGLAWLIGIICFLSAVTSLRFWLLGAWPVAAFSAVEIGLALFLIRLNVTQARQSEMLLLSDAGMRVVRTDPRGRREEHVLPPAWLSIVMEERTGRVPALFLAAPGARIEVGRVLGEEQKRDLARALGEVLDGRRNPRFDNPQLRALPDSD